MNKDNYTPNYSLISKYRTVLMGIAIIFIMFCHLDVAQSQNGVAVSSLARASHIFTVGVDIFLFLSGIGLYYSYTKKRQPYFEFEKKRLVRILPLYFIIGGATYVVYDGFIKHFGIVRILKDLLFVSWFATGTTKYWYILAIVVFYLIFPFLYQFIHKGSYSLLKTLLFSICWWALIEALCVLSSSIGLFRIALARLPVFVIGIYFGKLSYENEEISKGQFSLLFLCGYMFFIGLKTPLLKPISSYLYYPVRAILAISIMITVIWVMEFLERKNSNLFSIVFMIFSWFGGLTLELYLLHQSYMILFEFPYKLTTYPIAAFILPTITAGLIWLFRKIIKKG